MSFVAKQQLTFGSSKDVWLLTAFVVVHATTELCDYDGFLQHRLGFHAKLSQDILTEDRDVSNRNLDGSPLRKREMTGTRS